MDPTTASTFRRDYFSAQQDVQAGVVPSRARAANSHWDIWTQFCSELGLHSSLQECQDPVPYLQVFARRYREGSIAPRKKRVRSRTVEDALRSVGQTFASVGSSDPRLTTQGNIDFRLQRQLACYSKQDPPPDRVKPVPIQILKHLHAVASVSLLASNLAIADMMIIAFFYLLRPGEYTGSPTDTTPFKLQDVQLSIGHTRLDLLTASDDDLLAASFATLTFTTQKNGVRGEVVGLGTTGSPTFCPVRCLGRRVVHLRAHNAPLHTPLATYFENQTWKPVKPSHITSALKLSATLLGPTFGFLAKDVSARSLRAAGAMALLCANVDHDTIRLIGRWRSDEMLRYLHIQAEPVMRDMAKKMFHHGAFVLHPGQDVPMF